jgi:hypothetical protein
VLTWRHAGTGRSVTRTVRRGSTRSVGRSLRGASCRGVKRRTDSSERQDAPHVARAPETPPGRRGCDGPGLRLWQQGRVRPNGSDDPPSARRAAEDDREPVACSARSGCRTSKRRCGVRTNAARWDLGGLAADGRTPRGHRPSGRRKHRIYRARLPGFEARYAVVTVATP